ncbi:MAG: hypothetical protein JNM88_02935 [Chitinophagaceae bacterium]|nr:hypothetical protein [Chitinophagaceae bacterium]
MRFSISIKYYNPGLQIGIEDIKNAWYLPEGAAAVKLNTIVYQGQLTYRFPSSGKRISYRQLKKGLIKKRLIIRLPLELLPF